MPEMWNGNTSHGIECALFTAHAYCARFSDSRPNLMQPQPDSPTHDHHRDAGLMSSSWPIQIRSGASRFGLNRLLAARREGTHVALSSS